MPFGATVLFLIFLFLTCNRESITAHENKDLRTKVAKEPASEHHICLKSLLMFKEGLQNKILLFCYHWVSCSVQ